MPMLLWPRNKAYRKKSLMICVLAWAVEESVTSNSVIFAKNGTTVAIGTGGTRSGGMRGDFNS